MFFSSSVTRYPHASKDAHHKVTYGTSASLSCNYSRMSKVIQNQHGKDVLAVAWTQFPPGTSINYDDKIVLPDGSFSKIVNIHKVTNHVCREICVEVYYGGESL